MFKHFEGARLGIFIFLGTVLLVISIFLIGNKESLFVSSISVKTYFQRVEGLKSGAPVRLSGYDIGSVSNIILASDTSGRVEVMMNIDNDVKHFIRLDSKASIETEGLVGKKIVSITPGSHEAEMISDGGIIQSISPVNIAEIIGETQETMAYVKSMMKDFSEIVSKVNQGDGTIGRLINDDELYESTVTITQDADKSLNAITQRIGEVSDFILDISDGFANIVNNVDTATANVKMLIANINNGEGVIGALISDKNSYDSVQVVIRNLVTTTEEAMIGASRFAENMEALKHNWLFKNYFEQRGYWDKAAYQIEIDQKLKELKNQNELLDQKIQEMLNLEEKTKDSQAQGNLENPVQPQVE